MPPRDDFTQAYIDTLATDQDVDPCALSADALAILDADAAEFQREWGGVIDASQCKDAAYSNRARAGRDFARTRNATGGGFWDGDWPPYAGYRLTQAAAGRGRRELR